MRLNASGVYSPLTCHLSPVFTSHLTFKRSTYISNTLQYRPLMELYAFGHVIHFSI